MKKIIAALAGLSLFAAAATAEGVSFTLGSLAVWDVVANGQDANGGDDLYTGTTLPWGGQKRVLLGFSAESEHAGAKATLGVIGGKVALDGSWLGWIRPIEQIKITVGSMDENELQRSSGFGIWNLERIGVVAKTDGDHWIFDDYLDTDGVSVSVYPIEGLTVGASVKIADWATGDETTTADRLYTLKTAYTEGVKAAAWYNIEGIGGFGVGFSNYRNRPWRVETVEEYGEKWDEPYQDYDVMKLGAAFELTAVENLRAAVGAHIPTDFKGIDVNFAVDFTVMDGLTLHLIEGNKLNTPYADVTIRKDEDGEEYSDDKVKEDGGFGIMAGVGVDYNMDNGLGLFADVRYANDIWMDATCGKCEYELGSGCLTFGLGVSKAFTNSSITIGFEGTTSAEKYSGVNGARFKDENSFAFVVPVKFDISF